MELVHTSSSPFKVSIDESNIQPSLINASVDINNRQIKSSNSETGKLIV